MSSLTELARLSRIIADSLASLEKACSDSQATFPSLNEPGFNPASEAFRANPVAAEACKAIAAAGLQLASAVLPPPDALYLTVSGGFHSAALRVALEANVTEILREAGPEGMHANEIGKKAGIDGMRLGRLLRVLATHHVYREIKPDVFTNNRISGMLDTMKPHKELLDKPANKNDQTPGFAALVGHHLDETFKAAAFLWESMSDPKAPRTGKEVPAPFQYAFNEKGSLWEWYEKPENAHRLKRFGQGMQGVAALQPPEAILSAFSWETLPADSVVVDVGGGVGTSTLPLATNHKQLKLIVQDRPPVVEEGAKLWGEKAPEALSSGRAKFMAHDFFTEQPVKKPAVFLLKQILHDWSDPWSYDILTQLRAAAGPDTKLLLIDSVMPYACRDTTNSNIPGAVPTEAPEPLLGNWGAAQEMGYTADEVMMFLFNSQERTVYHLEALLKSTGWKLVAVRRNDTASGFLQPVEAVPI